MRPTAASPRTGRILAAAGGLLLALGGPSRAAQNPPAGNGADKPAENLPVLSLGDCIGIAVVRQPALGAVRASQQATAAGQNALANIGRLGSLLSPDLDVRRQQSARGVAAAAADVQKLHNEIVHDVTLLYYKAVYARQQAAFAEEVVEQVDTLVAIARRLLQAKTEVVMTETKLNVMLLGLADAKKLLLEAQQGEKRAFAALREVMGVGADEFRFRLRDEELPLMRQDVPLTRERVVEMALCQRPELVLAAAGADVFRLEVYAQDRIGFRRTVPTFASGSDIHARMVPPGSRDPGTDYRPEPILPEMPVQLVGSKADRVARALWFSERTDKFYDKIRGLIRLEAENAFFNFETAAGQLVIAKGQDETAKKLMEWVQANLTNQRVEKTELADQYSRAARAQAAYVESVLKYLLALNALERVTAGGVRPAFPGR